MKNQEELNCSILSFLDGAQGDSCGTVYGWSQKAYPIQLLSSCCLHATEARNKIVDDLDLSQLDLLVRVAQYVCDKLNPWLWQIVTLGSEDFSWLRDHELESVLLPYMSELSDYQVQDDLAKSFDLTMQMASCLEDAVGVPVQVSGCAQAFKSVDISYLRQVSKSRVQRTVQALDSNPPKIFSQLNPLQRLLRVENEQMLYLANTVLRGQRPSTETGHTLQLLIEVHGGYIESGQLHRGPKGEFLPTAILPSCVRQHWATWKATKPNTIAAASALGKKLAARGY